MSFGKLKISKMTNKADDGEPYYDPRLAALLAVHLVSQVLDEAYVIANAARESGQPWRYVSMLKNVRSGKLSETVYENMSFAATKGDSYPVSENKTEIAANAIATSTPQKYAGCSDELSNTNADTSFIGQGDETIEVGKNELLKPTSMFFDHLFDICEFERPNCDVTEIKQNASEADELLTEPMNKTMESYVNTALGMAQDVQPNDIWASTEILSSDHSAYSFLADAFVTNVDKDIGFYVKDDLSYRDESNLETANVIDEMTEQANKTSEERVEKNDVAAYENAYLTLNRDYDQCSEDGDPVLQDPKGLTMQEVELITASTSNDNLFSYSETKPKTKEFAATSAASATASGSRKSTLARRCRIQGAKLLACIRGWWHRKTPRKCKEARMSGGSRGLCPLSPGARQRASSLLDQRMLRSLSPSRPIIWKFNTVNETVVNSSRWKDYTFDMKSDNCSEC